VDNRSRGAGRCNPGITWIVGSGLHALGASGSRIKELGEYWRSEGEMSAGSKRVDGMGRAVGKKPQIPGVIPQHYPTSV
jgi:hypothetical protein